MCSSHVLNLIARSHRKRTPIPRIETLRLLARQRSYVDCDHCILSRAAYGLRLRTAVLSYAVDAGCSLSSLQIHTIALRVFIILVHIVDLEVVPSVGVDRDDGHLWPHTRCGKRWWQCCGTHDGGARSDAHGGRHALARRVGIAARAALL